MSASGSRTLPSSLPTAANAQLSRWRFTSASPAAFPLDRALPVRTIFSPVAAAVFAAMRVPPAFLKDLPDRVQPLAAKENPESPKLIGVSRGRFRNSDDASK